MITIDGGQYNVDVIGLKRKADFLDKYAERTEDGVLKRELIGVYFNYELKFGPGADPVEYARLWSKLTEPEEFHQVTVPDCEGNYTFTAYFSGISDEILLKKESRNFWKNLTVNFIARSPART